MTFQFVAIAGGPHERGRQYGEQARGRIENSLNLYLPAFASKGLDWGKVRELAERFAEVIGGYETDFIAEMSGIATGAGLELAHVVALNARTELLNWQDDGCTAAACLPSVTADGHTLLGQNWDWRPECIDSAIVLHIKPESGPALLTFVEAGLLARAGLNSVGIGVVGNFLQSSKDFGGSGIPIPLIRRRILSSESMADAIGWVTRTPRAFSSNHLIADAAGIAIDCEASPEEVFFVHPEGGILEHSNHFRSLAAQVKLHDTGIDRFPDSLYRDRRLRELLASSGTKIDRAAMVTGFRDHLGAPNSICRHSTPRMDGTPTATVSSLLMDLDLGKLWVAEGPTCSNEYGSYEVKTVADINAA